MGGKNIMNFIIIGVIVVLAGIVVLFLISRAKTNDDQQTQSSPPMNDFSDTGFDNHTYDASLSNDSDLDEDDDDHRKPEHNS